MMSVTSTKQAEMDATLNGGDRVERMLNARLLPRLYGGSGSKFWRMNVAGCIDG